jgi:recombination protein RecT
MAQANTSMVKAVKADLEEWMPKISEALPMTARKYLTPDRMVKVAITAISKTPALLNCDRGSILAAVMEMSQLGLELGGAMGHAYLIPFKRTAVPIIGYRGYIALARRSGEIESVSAQVVFSRDQFELDLGSGDAPKHYPCLEDDRGEVVAVYCVARFKDGGKHVEYMTVSDVKKIQARSPSVRAGRPSPWDTDWNEMAKKTVVRRAAKYWPLSIELADALDHDNRTDGGLEVIDITPKPIDDDEPEPESRTEEVTEALRQRQASAEPSQEPMFDSTPSSEPEAPREPVNDSEGVPEAPSFKMIKAMRENHKMPDTVWLEILTKHGLSPKAKTVSKPVARRLEKDVRIWIDTKPLEKEEEEEKPDYSDRATDEQIDDLRQRCYEAGIDSDAGICLAIKGRLQKEYESLYHVPPEVINEFIDKMGREHGA